MGRLTPQKFKIVMVVAVVCIGLIIYSLGAGGPFFSDVLGTASAPLLSVGTGMTDGAKEFINLDGMTKQELKAFMAGKREIETLTLYKQLKRMGETVTMEQTEKIRGGLNCREREWIQLARTWGVFPVKLYRYFERQNKQPNMAMSAWADYLKCAEPLGYALQRSDSKRSSQLRRGIPLGMVELVQ